MNSRNFLTSPRYDTTHIVDRVGGGDAFAAGLIYGLHTRMADGDAINFVVAACCLKHSIPGEVNLSIVAKVLRLMGGNQTGQVQR